MGVQRLFLSNRREILGKWGNNVGLRGLVKWFLLLIDYGWNASFCLRLNPAIVSKPLKERKYFHTLDLTATIILQRF